MTSFITDLIRRQSFPCEITYAELLLYVEAGLLFSYMYSHTWLITSSGLRLTSSKLRMILLRETDS